MRWSLFLLLSCSLVRGPSQTSSIPDVKEITVYNGKVKYVSFELMPGEHADHVICKEQNRSRPLIKKMPIFLSEGAAHFYYAEGYHSKAEKHRCFLGQRKVLDITVKMFPYKEEFLKVAKGKVVLSKKNQARAAKEWHMTQRIYRKSLKKSLINGPFIVPLNSYITSHYGKRRVFNNLKKTQHLGNDFRAKVGVPIPVSNRGKVVFAGDLFYTGNVVIVDHGLNLFTLYAHLSKLKAIVGDVVEKGEIIGLSGRTGRVSGPHLHWGVKLHGFNVDGFSLVKESKLQFQNHVIIQ